MGTAAFFTLFLIIGAATHGEARTGLLVTAFVLLCVPQRGRKPPACGDPLPPRSVFAALVLYLLARQAVATHARQLASGEWHEGVIVFSSGDVLLRFMGVFGNVDTTIESRYLSRADVKPQFTLGRCGTRRYLQVYYLGLDTRPKVASILEDDLTDDVSTIAGYINDAKAKNYSTTDF